jgi:RNA polymerase sigma-70 factor (ECF subfamily)
MSQLRRVFVLREIEELEPDDACEIAAISRDSLAVFLYRARQALRTCMQKKWLAP